MLDVYADPLVVTHSGDGAMNDPRQVKRNPVRRLCRAQIAATSFQAFSEIAKTRLEHLGDQNLVKAALVHDEDAAILEEMSERQESR